jgi:hypothetical protein
MKQLFNRRTLPALLAAFALQFSFFACTTKEDDNSVKTYKLTVRVEYPDGYAPKKDVKVTLRRTGSESADEGHTDATGTVTFTTIAGIHEASASETRVMGANIAALNGVTGSIAVTDTRAESDTVRVTMVASKSSALLIKEFYVGGCQDETGKAFTKDAYFILYNNSDSTLRVDNLTFGTCFSLNAHATNNFIVGDALVYASDTWLPAAFGVWSIRGALRLEPGEQRVVAMNSANDHTVTVPNSVNLANSAYYAAYDPESGFSNINNHPAPSELIPSSQYLSAIRFSGVTATAWTFSLNSPAFFIFAPEGSLPDFANNPDNRTLHGTSASQAALKVPRSWTLDGIEVFQQGNTDKSVKRLTPDIDAGYAVFTNNKGYTLYRNVNKEATEALPGNAGKLVTGYSDGTSDLEGGSSDPSGIDAEASIRNGARIIYKDSNNSTQDFHQRKKASLRN